MIEEEAIEKIIGSLRSLQDDHTYMLRGQAPVDNKLSFHCQILTKRTKEQEVSLELSSSPLRISPIHATLKPSTFLIPNTPHSDTMEIA
jgi:hypothetical protein